MRQYLGWITQSGGYCSFVAVQELPFWTQILVAVLRKIVVVGHRKRINLICQNELLLPMILCWSYFILRCLIQISAQPSHRLETHMFKNITQALLGIFYVILNSTFIPKI